MNDIRLTRAAKTAIRRNMKEMVFYPCALLTATALGGCVQIAAPERPIEINLYIKIEQQVVVRIEGAVKDAIEENSEIF